MLFKDFLRTEMKRKGISVIKMAEGLQTSLQAYWTIIVYNICPARYIYQLSCKCHLSHFCHMIFRNMRLKVQEKTSSTCNYTMVARAFNANKKYPTQKGRVSILYSKRAFTTSYRSVIVVKHTRYHAQSSRYIPTSPHCSRCTQGILVMP